MSEAKPASVSPARQREGRLDQEVRGCEALDAELEPGKPRQRGLAESVRVRLRSEGGDLDVEKASDAGGEPRMGLATTLDRRGIDEAGHDAAHALSRGDRLDGGVLAGERF